ncbi:MAG: S8 family serine peptidase [Pontiellaceae bacterium]|nr:S8 family serine peptidase [Pontiellaceae bacterium]
MKRKVIGSAILSCIYSFSQAQSSEQLEIYKTAVASLENFNQIQREAGMPEMAIPTIEEWIEKGIMPQTLTDGFISEPVESAALRWQRRLKEIQPYLCELVPAGAEHRNDRRVLIAKREKEKLIRLTEEAKARQPEIQRKLNALKLKYNAGQIWENTDTCPPILAGEVDDRPIWIDNVNLYAAASIGADRLWPTNVATWVSSSTEFNLTGTNIVLGMWETHSLATTNHVEYSGRLVQKDAEPLSSYGSHANAVAGTIAAAGELVILPSVGTGDFARGVAYEARVESHNLEGFSAEILEASTGSQGVPGVRVSNHSWGIHPAWQEIFIASYWHNDIQYVRNAPGWVWFRGQQDHEDYECGRYTEDLDIGNGCTQLDNFLATQAPRHLMISAAGNGRYEGPGGPTNYFRFNVVLGRWEQATYDPQLSVVDWAVGDDDNIGFDSLRPPGTAKNILTVGAVQDVYHTNGGFAELGYTTNAALRLHYYSGCGPTDDGRIKPDVMAVGEANPDIRSFGLVSPSSGSSGYTTNNLGTSFAAASVSGGFGLLLQHRTQLFPDLDPEADAFRNSTLKALAIHTADDVWNDGPDYVTGWGIFNVASAAEHLSLDARDGRGSHIKELELLIGGTNSWPIQLTGEPFKVTAVWSDPVGTPNGIDDSPLPMLVNNLDLWVENEDGSQIFYPWVLNPDLTNESYIVRSTPATTGYDDRNNIEQVSISAPTAGNYRIFITHSGGLIGGPAPTNQWVSILTSGDVPLPPAITGLEHSPTNNEFLFSFECDPGAHLILESATNLLSSTWTEEGSIETFGANNALIVTATNEINFWRLRRQTGGAE